MRILLTALLLLLVGALSAQQPIPTTERYLRYADSALQLYRAKDYKASAQLYEQAFKANGATGRADDHYNAACSFARAGDREKAIYHLGLAALLKWSGADHLQKDSDLQPLHTDSRWPNIVAQVKKNKQEAEAKQDKALVAQLNAIHEEDQALRRTIDTLYRKYGWESKEVQALLPTMAQKDSLNLVQVKTLLDTRGWLGADVVGSRGNQTLFLVIQHADSATMAKYLPLLRQAVKEGKALPSQLALMEDRTRMDRGEKQLYGSQVIQDPVTGKPKFHPIEDEPNVNKRRATMGLGPIETYARNFGIEYTVPAGRSN